MSWSIAMAAIGAAAIGLLSWLSGMLIQRARGKTEAERKRADALAARKEVDDEVRDLGPADVDTRFDRWVRRDR